MHWNSVLHKESKEKESPIGSKSLMRRSFLDKKKSILYARKLGAGTVNEAPNLSCKPTEMLKLKYTISHSQRKDLWNKYACDSYLLNVNFIQIAVGTWNWEGKLQYGIGRFLMASRYRDILVLGGSLLAEIM